MTVAACGLANRRNRAGTRRWLRANERAVGTLSTVLHVERSDVSHGRSCHRFLKLSSSAQIVPPILVAAGRIAVA